MSRSYRKTPIHGFCGCNSEKLYKRFANRKLRRKNKIKLNLCLDYDDLILFLMDEIANIYSFGKDGKFYFGSKDCLKQIHFKKLLRK